MNSFFKKQKLVESLSLTLNCDKATFVEKFHQNVELSNLSFSFFEVFSSGSKLYKGNIQNSTFKIQKKQQLFNNKKQSAVANGKIIEGINNIKIDLEINAITPKIKFFFGVITCFYLLFILIISFASLSNSSFPFFLLPMLFFHACFMIVIVFFGLKASVKNFKQEIEREFHFWLR